MSALGVALLALYGGGVLLSWRPVFRAIFKDLTEYGTACWEDVVVASILATIAVWVWPLAAPFVVARTLIGGDAEKVGRRLGGESRADKARRLERDLGIGQCS